MCYCPSVTRRPAKSQAAADAFEQWHLIGVEKGIRRIDNLVEIQTRINRALDDPHLNVPLARDLHFMLLEIMNENRLDCCQIEFPCEAVTSKLFIDLLMKHTQLFSDESNAVCTLPNGNSYLIITLKDAWTFIKHASLVALKVEYLPD